MSPLRKCASLRVIKKPGPRVFPGNRAYVQDIKRLLPHGLCLFGHLVFFEDFFYRNRL